MPQSSSKRKAWKTWILDILNLGELWQSGRESYSSNLRWIVAVADVGVSATPITRPAVLPCIQAPQFS